MLARRMPWTTQPPAGTPIDWSHWAGSACEFAYNANGNYDAVRQVVGSTQPAKVVSKHGGGINTQAGGTTVGPSRAIPTKPFTILVVANLISWGGAYVSLMRRYDSGSGGGFVFGIDTGGRLDFTIFGVASYPFGASLYDAALPVRVAAVVVDGANATAYLDGKSYAQVTIGAITAGSCAPIVQMGSVHVSSCMVAGQLFRGAFSSAQIASLSDNPWQIFRP